MFYDMYAEHILITVLQCYDLASTVAVASNDGQIKLYNVANGQQVGSS